MRISDWSSDVCSSDFTMKLGAMAARLPEALDAADLVFCFGASQGKHALGWDPAQISAPLGKRATAYSDLDKMIEALCQAAQAGDSILVMSNGGFGEIGRASCRERVCQFV